MRILRPGGTYRDQFNVAGVSGDRDADSLPTAAAVRNGAVDVAVAVTVTRVATGTYVASFAVPPGYAAGDDVWATPTALIAGLPWSGTTDVVTLSSGGPGPGGVGLAPGGADPSAVPAPNSDPALLIQAVAARLGVCSKATYDKDGGEVVVYRSDGVTAWFSAPASSSASADSVGPGA